MAKKDQLGLLLVTMEPPASLEEEFADWYDTEHVPERARIPGFMNALRFVCVSGWPRFVAVYDLEALEVLDSPGYRAVSGELFSPWSKRVLGRVRGQYRAAAVQIFPGQAVTSRFVSMTLMRYRGITAAQEDGFVRDVQQSVAALKQDHVLALRIFRFGNGSTLDHLVMVEWSVGANMLEAVAPPSAFAKHLDLSNVYVQYWTRGHLPGVYH